MNYAKSISRNIMAAVVTVAAASTLSAAPLVMEALESPRNQATVALLNGNYEVAINKSEAVMNRHAGPGSKLVAMTNLCIAYTVTHQYDKATEFCDRAVDVGKYKWIALNNRAVLNCMKRDMRASISDLQLAARKIRYEGHADGAGISPYSYNKRITRKNLRQVEADAASMVAFQEPPTISISN